MRSSGSLPPYWAFKMSAILQAMERQATGSLQPVSLFHFLTLRVIMALIFRLELDDKLLVARILIAKSVISPKVAVFSI